MSSVSHAGAKTKGAETPLGWPLQLWSQALSNPPWSNFAERNDPKAKSIRTTQDELIDETRHLLDHWCDRQQNAVKDAWSLISDLQRADDGTAAMTAWFNWHRSAMERLAEDAREQIEFASKASECCNRLMSQGHAGSPTSISSPKRNERDLTNGKARHRDS